MFVFTLGDLIQLAVVGIAVLGFLAYLGCVTFAASTRALRGLWFK